MNMNRAIVAAAADGGLFAQNGLKTFQPERATDHLLAVSSGSMLA